MKAIYVRVSTEEQALKGYSVQEQIDECLKKIGDYNALKYVDDGWSGEILDGRPGLTKLREDVASGLITEVVVYDPDRLSRQLMIQLIVDNEFRSKGVNMVFVNGEYANTPEGKMFFQMRGAISEFEKAKIKQRTMGGKRRKAKEGKIVKNDRIYGYTFNKDKNNYDINEDQAAIVRQMFEWYDSGKFKGTNSLALYLTDRGVPTAKNKKVWHRQVVKQILTNEAYAGTFYQNKWDTEGNYVRKQSGKKQEYKLRPREEWIPVEIPAIVSRELFDNVQVRLGQAKRRSAGYSKHDYLLSGLVRCGRCGCTMPGRKTKSHGKDYYIYHCRKNYAGAKHRGCGKQISENKLNNEVWRYLEDLFVNPEKISQYSEQKEDRSYIKSEMDRVTKEIEKNKKGRQNLIALVSLGGDIDLSEIQAQIIESQKKEKEYMNYYKQLEEEIKEDEKTNESVFQQALEKFVSITDPLTFEQKQNLIRMAVKEVVITPEGNIHIYLF